MHCKKKISEGNVANLFLQCGCSVNTSPTDASLGLCDPKVVHPLDDAFLLRWVPERWVPTLTFLLWSLILKISKFTSSFSNFFAQSLSNSGKNYTENTYTQILFFCWILNWTLLCIFYWIFVPTLLWIRCSLLIDAECAKIIRIIWATHPPPASLLPPPTLI
jgi:hypothetical protein